MDPWPLAKIEISHSLPGRLLETFVLPTKTARLRVRVINISYSKYFHTTLFCGRPVTDLVSSDSSPGDGVTLAQCGYGMGPRQMLL